MVELTADRDSIEAEGCARPIPDSLSTWGWAKARRKGSFGHVYDFVYQQTSDGQTEFFLPWSTAMRHENRESRSER